MKNPERVASILAFLCVVLIVAGAIIGPMVGLGLLDKNKKATSDQHVTIDLDQNIKHYRYKNHEYLVFETNKHLVVLHDPDCLCHRKD